MNFLYDYFSVPRCKNAGQRHIRLCRQNQGGEKYEQAISPVYNGYLDRIKAADDAENEKYAAKDKVRLCDSQLDDKLINLHHSSDDYDRTHTGSYTRTALFPNGNYTEVTRMNIYKEPAKASEIALKVAALGESHELYHFAAEINTAVAACNAAIEAEKTAINAEGSAKAMLEISKLELIRKYNSNYYNAADEGGKAFAERLFPDLGPGPKNDPDTETETGNAS